MGRITVRRPSVVAVDGRPRAVAALDQRLIGAPGRGVPVTEDAARLAGWTGAVKGHFGGRALAIPLRALTVSSLSGC
jgi:hypothetical protein